MTIILISCIIILIGISIMFYLDYKSASKVIINLLEEYNNLKLEHQKEIELARKESVKKSKDVTRGHISEEFIPLFPDFPYDMSECRFLGKPIDYIVYQGMNNVRDGVPNSEISITFADVKVNSSQRNKVQNAIKKAIEEGRVRWETWKIDNNKQIIIK